MSAFVPARVALIAAVMLLASAYCARAATFTFKPVPDDVQVAEYLDSAQQHRLQPEGTIPAQNFSQLVQRFALVTLETRTHTDDIGAHYKARIVVAREWRGFGEPEAKDSPVAGKRYDYTVADHKIVALNERGVEASPKQLGLAATLFRKPGFVEELGRFLDGKDLDIGDELIPASSLSVRLSGLPNTRMKLRSLSAYWQRDVAVFDLFVTGAKTTAGILTSVADAQGVLLVDVATARPLHIALRAQLAGRGPTKTRNNTFTHAGFSLRTRALSYADVPLFGQGIDLIVPNAPTGAVSDVALEDDGSGLLISSTTGGYTSAHRVALWDLAAARQAGSTSATVGPHIVSAPGAAMLLNYDNDANAVALTTVGSEVEHFGRYLRRSQPNATAFGALGVYGLIGNVAGEARIYNFGHDKGLVHKVSEVPVVAVHGLPTTGHLLTVDASGMLRRFALTTNKACGGSGFTSYCKRAPFTIAKVPDLERQLPFKSKLANAATRTRIRSAVSADGAWFALAFPRVEDRAPTQPRESILVDLSTPDAPLLRVPGSLPAFTATQLATSAGLYSRDGELVRSFAGFDLPAEVTALAVTPDAQTLFVAAANAVSMFDIESGVHTRRIRSQVPGVKRVAWLDGALLAVHDQGFSALEFATSTLTHTRLGDVSDVQFADTPNANPVIAVQGLFGGVFVVHTGAGSAARVQPIHEGLVTRMQLSRDSNFIAVQAGLQIHTYSTADGSLRYTINSPQPAQAIALASEGSALVLHGGSLERFDGTGQKVAFTNLEHATMALSAAPRLALSNDGSIAAVAAMAGQHEARWNDSIPVIRLLDAKTLTSKTDLYPTWGQIRTLAFSADGRNLSAGLGSGDLVTWDTTTGMRVARWHAHEDGITDLEPLDDGRMLSAGEDGLVRLWNLAYVTPPMPVTGLAQRLLDKVLMFGRRKPHLIASTMFLRDGDYAITTPDGYFVASKSALTALAFRRQLGDLSTFEQFDLWLHRPDIVLDRMQAIPAKRRHVLRTAHAKRIRRHSGAADAPPFWSAAQPRVSISTKPAGRTRDAFTRVELDVKAGDAPVAELIVSANSVPMVRQAIDARAWQGHVDVPLLSGANQLEAYVRDASGMVSPRRSWSVYRLNDAPATRLWVVSIGVSEYQHESIRLRYAAKDANDLAAFFGAAGNQKEHRYQAIKTLALTDADVTRASLARIRNFLSAAAPDDQVMVFVSGHGFLSKDAGYYFGTWDVDPAEPARRGLSYDDLLSVFDGLQAHRRVLLLDTCHAGELDPDTPTTSLPVLAMPDARVNGSKGIGVVKQTKAPAPVDLEASFDAMREHFVTLSDQSGANVLAAAGGLEYALESKRWNNGVFTFAIMEGLGEKRADANKDGVVMLSELRAYVAGRVQALTGGGQQPTSRAENIYVDFPIL